MVYDFTDDIIPEINASTQSSSRTPNNTRSRKAQISHKIFMKPEILQNLAIAVLRSFPWAQPYRMKTAAWNNVAAEFNEALPPGQATLTGIQAKRQVERSIKEYQAYKKDAAAGKDYLSFEHLYGNSALRSQLEILLQRREIIGRNLNNDCPCDVCEEGRQMEKESQALEETEEEEHEYDPEYWGGRKYASCAHCQPAESDADGVVGVKQTALLSRDELMEDSNPRDIINETQNFDGNNDKDEIITELFGDDDDDGKKQNDLDAISQEMIKIGKNNECLRKEIHTLEAKLHELKQQKETLESRYVELQKQRRVML